MNKELKRFKKQMTNWISIENQLKYIIDDMKKHFIKQFEKKVEDKDDTKFEESLRFKGINSREIIPHKYLKKITCF